MRIRNFLASVYDDLPKRLPAPLREHDWQLQPSRLQISFHRPRVHYELRVRHKARCLEIGLHFQGEREENERWAEALAASAQEIQAQLGPGVELEQVTRRRIRLLETLPLSGDPTQPISRALTEELIPQVAERLGRFIAVLEPILARR